jgi:hypothetical protein
MSRYPSALVTVLTQARVCCAEVRSAMSSAAAQDLGSRPALAEMPEHQEADREALIAAANDLADVEHAIAKALGTTFPTKGLEE